MRNDHENEPTSGGNADRPDSDDHDSLFDSSTPGTDSQDSTDKKPGCGEEMLAILNREAVIFLDRAGMVWATLRLKNGVLKTVQTGSADVRYWLKLRYHRMTGKFLSNDILAGPIDVWVAGALESDDEPQDVYMRLAPFPKGKALWIDLGPKRGAVMITPGFWEVTEQPQNIPFYRPVGYLPMTPPAPAEEGDLGLLRRFLNCPDTPEGDEMWQYFLIWLIAAFFPTGPQLILILNGEQGSGKTISSWALCQLLDPNTTDTNTEPKSDADILFQGSRSLVVAFDNLRGITPTIADSFCRVSTGVGWAKRKLFSDGDVYLVTIKRPVILTGINEIHPYADMLDRSLVMRLPSLREEGRRTMSEDEYKEQFAADQPKILAGLYNIVAKAMEKLPDIRKQTGWRHRMGDGVMLAMAAEEELGWEPGTVERLMRKHQGQVSLAEVEDHPVLSVLIELLRCAQDEPITDLFSRYLCEDRLGWDVSEQTVARADAKKMRGLPVKQADGIIVIHGTMQEVFLALTDFARSHEGINTHTGWPQRANGLGKRIRQAKTALAERGITFLDEKDSHTRRVTVTIRYDPKQDKTLGTAAEGGAA